MAHFARIKNSQVIRVHVVNNEVITDENGVEQEELGKKFLAELHGVLAEEFVQCSYNSNFRAHYPALGYTYDLESDVFIPPQPYSSWILNTENYIWEPPIPRPDGDGYYAWDDLSIQWVLIESSS